MEKHLEALKSKDLVGEAAGVLAELEDARDRMTLMADILTCYRGFLDNACMESSLEEFLQIAGRGLRNSALLTELVFPETLVRDLALMEACHLLSVGRYEEVYTALSGPEYLKKRPGGNVAEFQEFVYERLVQKLIRDRPIGEVGGPSDDAVLVADKLAAFLGPCLGLFSVNEFSEYQTSVTEAQTVTQDDTPDADDDADKADQDAADPFESTWQAQ